MNAPLDSLPEAYAADVRAVQDIDVVPMILDVVCATTGLGFAAVARVTEERWVACAVRDTIAFGLQPGGELEVQTTICNEIRASGQLVAIDDVHADAVFRDHHTPRRYGFRSYISVPILNQDGSIFGTLCAIDPRPARVTSDQVVNTLRLFADLIGRHLHTHDQLRRTSAALTSATENASLQDQFVAILSHDLRSPLAAIQTATRMLQAMGLGAEAERLTQVIARSGVRMNGLVSNVLDFARVRLGDGLPLEAVDNANLVAELEAVIEEVRTAFPGRLIDATLDLHGGMRCDPARIAQLLANLLGNALVHGHVDGRVTVEASDRGEFALAVSNQGAPIPAGTLGRLFQPFVRGNPGDATPGLGLGLFIASEIARGHHGTLTAMSSPEHTTFTFRMPIVSGTP